MAKFLMTHSLLSAWQYALKDNPYEDATSETDAMQDFLKVLRREPTETTEAMQNGLMFENLVDAIAHGGGNQQDSWFPAASKIASRVHGGVTQVKINKEVCVGGFPIVLHGRLDWLKAGEIVDVKFTKSYDHGKFFTSTQHPMYMELVPEASSFTYLVSNGSGVWSEKYRRDEISSIFPTIECFLGWLKATGNMDTYKKFWCAR